MLYAADVDWWKHHKSEVDRLSCLKVKPEPESPVSGVLSIKGQSGNSFITGELNYGSNSGFQAICLSVMWGADRIVLLGYDMSNDKSGKRHWFGEHPEGVLRRSSNFPGFIACFAEASKAKLNIINCSKSTALLCFDRANLRDTL